MAPAAEPARVLRGVAQAAAEPGQVRLHRLEPQLAVGQGRQHVLDERLVGDDHHADRHGPDLVGAVDVSLADQPVEGRRSTSLATGRRPYRAVPCHRGPAPGPRAAGADAARAAAGHARSGPPNPPAVPGPAPPAAAPSSSTALVLNAVICSSAVAVPGTRVAQADLIHAA